MKQSKIKQTTILGINKTENEIKKKKKERESFILKIDDRRFCLINFHFASFLH